MIIKIRKIQEIYFGTSILFVNLPFPIYAYLCNGDGLLFYPPSSSIKKLLHTFNTLNTFHDSINYSIQNRKSPIFHFPIKKQMLIILS
jgi:hypothetical protein